MEREEDRKSRINHLMIETLVRTDPRRDVAVTMGGGEGGYREGGMGGNQRHATHVLRLWWPADA